MAARLDAIPRPPRARRERLFDQPGGASVLPGKLPLRSRRIRKWPPRSRIRPGRSVRNTCRPAPCTAAASNVFPHDPMLKLVWGHVRGHLDDPSPAPSIRQSWGLNIEHGQAPKRVWVGNGSSRPVLLLGVGSAVPGSADFQAEVAKRNGSDESLSSHARAGERPARLERRKL